MSTDRSGFWEFSGYLNRYDCEHFGNIIALPKSVFLQCFSIYLPILSHTTLSKSWFYVSYVSNVFSFNYDSKVMLLDDFSTFRYNFWPWYRRSQGVVTALRSRYGAAVSKKASFLTGCGAGGSGGYWPTWILWFIVDIWRFPKIVGVFHGKSENKMDDLGVPPF